METVYVIDAVRTPVAKYGGALSSVRPDDLLSYAIKSLLARNNEIDVSEIEDVIAGAANQAGEDNRNVARMAALLAGLPVSIPGNTVNRLCASGLQAVMDASRQIKCGDASLMIACGVESMTRAPFVMPKTATPFGRTPEIYDTTLGWRFVNGKLSDVHYPYSMGETAENVAKQWQISRDAQDAFAFNSQQKYFKTLEKRAWDSEIVPVETIFDKKPVLFKQDEHPRQTTLEKLASLKPAFAKEGTVTAGNSSGINDGAGAMLLAGEEAVRKYKLKPMAKVLSMAVAGVDPALMGMGPVPATQKALKRASLSIADMDLIELNEAFASQSLACIHDLNIDPANVNVNGGAIAIGHPLGCSGIRISTTLLHEMKRRGSKYGLATMCVGVGQGATIIYENCS